MTTRDRDLPHLGVILPDDPIASEMHTLDAWLTSNGRDDVTASTRLSTITGGHYEDILLRAGDLSVIGPVAEELKAQGCDAIVWACTSGSFIGGLDWCNAQADGLGRLTGLPASSTTLAFIAALRALEQNRVHVLAAYPEACTSAFIGCLHGSGITVESWTALDSPDGASSFKLALLEEVDAFTSRLPADDDAPILVPDTAINSLDVVAALEARAGRTVLTANQVTLWHGLALLGIDTRIANAGQLLAGASDSAVQEVS